MISPTPHEIRAARANTERLEAIVPRVVCMYCEHEISPGCEPWSHGLCDDEPCQKLASEPVTMRTVVDMHHHAMRANAHYHSTKRFRHAWTEREARDAAEHRFRVTLRLMVEDMEREIRRLRVAAAEATVRAARPTSTATSTPPDRRPSASHDSTPA